MKTSTKLWIALGVMALLTPLGLFLPAWFHSGPAWGEWGADEIKEFIGYAPKGLEKLSSLWHAALPDYGFRGQEKAGAGAQGASYLFAALVGAGLCVAVGLLLGKWLSRRPR